MALTIYAVFGLIFMIVAPKGNDGASSHTLTIELLVVVDYSDYKFWLDRTPTNVDSQARNTEAKDHIKMHVASLVKSSNVAYQSLQSYSIDINVKLVDVLIMETVAESPWTETLKYHNGTHWVVIANDAFTQFEPYAESLQRTVPHDHAMLLTRYVLHKEARKEGIALGVAKMSAECSSQSVSIVQDIGFSRANVMAHELGHSLGCAHDGEGNSCKEEDGYIMAAAQDADHMDRWQFSSCSASYIKEYIHNITLKRDNCMNSYQNRHPTDLSQNALWYGELYPTDTQCRLMFGEESHFCRDRFEGNFTDVCQKFFCLGSSIDTCYYRSDGAGDGTPCGHGKWCMSNRCVDAPKPIDVTDACIAGDKVGLVTVTIGEVQENKTCSEHVRDIPELCNTYYVKQMCCQTCQSIATTSVNVNDQCKRRQGTGSSLCWGSSVYNGTVISDVMCDKLSCIDPRNTSQCFYTDADDKTICGNHKWCMYGKCVYSKDAPASSDMCGWADVTGIAGYNVTCGQVRQPENNYLCYQKSIARLCCNTCHSIKRNKPGCEYGDKGNNCYTNIPKKTWWCYDRKNQDLCCESCVTHAHPETPDCLYGDRATNCLPDVPNHLDWCYSTNKTGHMCCGTCAKHANNARPDCKYGDHYNNCKVNLCNRYAPDVRRGCCVTCRDVVPVG